MKTNKERILKAFNQTIYKYKHPENEVFCRSDQCAICYCVKKGAFWVLCYPCPMASKYKFSGCIEFKSYRKVEKLIEYNFTIKPTKKNIKILNKRAEALQKMVSIMKKWPKERFTKKGWKYSGDEIPRSW